MPYSPPIFVYIHGLPGSAEEISGFNDVEILHIPPFGAKAFSDQFDKSKQYTIIGFSLGCMTAIEIAAVYSKNINQLILISPAAPLQLGNFLDNMDGRFVFKAAQANSALFWFLTLSQNLMAHVSPNFLMKKMFGESCEAELQLLKNAEFVKAFQNGLRQSLGRESQEYRKAIIRYTKPWTEQINSVTCTVQIYHGTQDTWAPHAMGQTLKATFKTKCELVLCKQLGHYSTLYYAMRSIFKQPSSG